MKKIAIIVRPIGMGKLYLVEYYEGSGNPAEKHKLIGFTVKNEFDQMVYAVSEPEWRDSPDITQDGCGEFRAEMVDGWEGI